MEKMTLYAYIQKRTEGRRTDSIVQDLIDDMKRDERLAGMNAQEIVNHIRWEACTGAREALTMFVAQYKRYCKAHGLVAENVTCGK